MDEDDAVLASAYDWAVSFASRFEKTIVITTRSGRFRPVRNLTVHAIGGGGIKQRILALVKLTRITRSLGILKNDVIFHHMSTKTLIWPGVLFWLRGIRQSVWYSHSRADCFLRLGLFFRPTIFTSTIKSFPVKSYCGEVFPVGHGVEIPTEIKKRTSNREPRAQIIFVGRIARIKRIELLVESLQPRVIQEGNGCLDILCVGPITDQSYRAELDQLAKNKSLNLEFCGAVPRKTVFKLMQNENIIFSATPSSTDKAAIEAAMLGCFVITTEEETSELCGMNYVWQELGYRSSEGLPTIERQARLLLGIPHQEKERLRKISALHSQQRNSLTRLTTEIFEVHLAQE